MDFIEWLVIVFFGLNVGYWAHSFNAGVAAFMLMIVLIKIQKQTN